MRKVICELSQYIFILWHCNAVMLFTYSASKCHNSKIDFSFFKSIFTASVVTESFKVVGKQNKHRPKRFTVTEYSHAILKA